MQTAEIDMKGVTFEPIGEETAFSGFYDGGKFAIKNLTISSGAREVGLFGSVAKTDDGGSILKNIVLDESCRISGSAEGCSIGAIAAPPAVFQTEHTDMALRAPHRWPHAAAD